MEFLALLGAGTLIFYALVVFVILILAFLTEDERWGWSAILVVVSVVVLNSTGVFDLRKVTSDPWFLGKFSLGYLVGALVWGAFKWWRFCVYKARQYQDARANFLKARGVADFDSDDMRLSFAQTLVHYGRNRVSAEPPRREEHYGKIVTWMVYWPASVVGFLVAEFLREVGRFMYDLMGGLYDAISKGVFKNYSGDILSNEQIIALKKQREKETHRRNLSL